MIEIYPAHGGQLRQIAERFRVPASQLLDFSANINPEGPPSAAVQAIRNSLDDLSVFTEYPDLEELELRASIGLYANVTAENISVVNGFVPLLEATLRALRIRRCLLPVPAFVEYRKTLERAEVEVDICVLEAESCFRYDPTILLNGQHDAILLANPQNPSGVCHDAAQMRELIERASQHNKFILLDEAFIDYVPEYSLTRAVEEFSNLIVFRSVTKFHGIPGLRVAYAVGNPSITKAISANLPPWPITTVASRGVCAALHDEDYGVRSRASNAVQRAELKRNLELHGLVTYPSQANFLLFRLPPAIDPISFWRSMIVDHHIVLRDCGNYEALAPGHFRVAVRRPEDNLRLMDAIGESLSRHT